MNTGLNTREHIFYPPKRMGMIIQGGMLAALATGVTWGIWQLAFTPIGPRFLQNLLLILICIAPVPVIVYRMRALHNAAYFLERDGIRLRWGFRQVDIPIHHIEWIHPKEDLIAPLPMPWLYWAGAILGPARHSLQEAGRVDFLASSRRGMLLIGTPGQVYAISPEDPQTFTNTYQRLIELGSLTPLPSRNIYPSTVYSRIWQVRPARYLLLGSSFFSLTLFAWVTLAIPARNEVYLGSTPFGTPPEPIPATGLLLLPFLNTVFVALNWGAGLYFFRREEHKPIAYLLWGGSVILPLLFMIGLGFILSYP